MTLNELRKFVLLEFNEVSIRRWCEERNVAHTHVIDFLHNRRNPPADLLDALNLEWRVMPKVSKSK